MLIHSLVTHYRARHPDKPALIGVGGAQGSGKTTLCAHYAATHAAAAHFSLDDVYKTRAERAANAATAHPLLLTRGPPGTHDLGLAMRVIARLREPLATPLPRFDKARDDRAPESAWPVFAGPAAAILIDGWCLGVLPQRDSPPLNAVEREDEAGLWRRRMLSALEAEYAPFFALFDAIVYLQAPSWEIVRRWRGQQEESLLGRALTVEEGLALDRFVMHYERLTRAMLAGAHSAGWIVHLDENRNVVRIEQRP